MNLNLANTSVVESNSSINLANNYADMKNWMGNNQKLDEIDNSLFELEENN